MNEERALAAATHLEAIVDVRYWEDAEVDGIEDEDGSLIFGRDHSIDGSPWHIRIALDEGRVENWPAGMAASIHYKVCDQGEYWLTDPDGNRIAKSKGSYVPDEFLCHGEEGHGDYIIMDIDGTGAIVGYRRPQADPDRWIIL